MKMSNFSPVRGAIFFVCFLTIFLGNILIPPGHCIRNGKLHSGKEFYRFMVTLYKRDTTSTPGTHWAAKYWSCGGVLVSPNHVVTSAACLRDTYLVYAIAGTTVGNAYFLNASQKYHNGVVKRVVKVCLPELYTFDENVTHWAAMDIAVATLESPYNFSDEALYKTITVNDVVYGITPNKINLNLDASLEKPGSNGTIVGRGFANFYEHDIYKHKYKYWTSMYEGHVTLISKSECKKQWPSSMADVIDKYLICTGDGPSGFCTSDHGGPLVGLSETGEPMLVGVMSAFQVNTTTNRCMGPFLYTSVAASREFLECVLPDLTARKSCPKNKNFDIVTKNFG